MTNDPLLITLLDLDRSLNLPGKLIIGGGYGLFLKQLYLNENPQIRTLFPPSKMPVARTTQDIDLILRAELVTDSESMKAIRVALDGLGFRVVESAKFMQFERAFEQGQVKIDLLAAPLGEFASRVSNDSRRVRPKPSVNLHARKLEEAVAVELHPVTIPVSGILSSGEPHKTSILTPQTFTYLLMKLLAFRDRVDDGDKQHGQHHALDIYRIIGLMTEAEDADVRNLSKEFAENPVVVQAREIAAESFVTRTGIGRIRIQEHPLFTPQLDLDDFGKQLEDLLFQK